MAFTVAKISQRTAKGDWVGDWNGRPEGGKKLLFPRTDQRLRINMSIDVDGMRRGVYFLFPLRYDVAGELERRTPLSMGVIEQDRVDYDLLGTFTDHWRALTDDPDTRWMNLRKTSGPYDADLGSVVEIYRIAYQGISHIFVNDWNLAQRQYPAEPLTKEQIARITELGPNFLSDPEVGSIALNTLESQIAVLDNRDGRPRTKSLPHSYLPIGARILIGIPRDYKNTENLIYQI